MGSIENNAKALMYAQRKNKMRRKIISMSYQMGWFIWGVEKNKPDFVRIDNWCNDKGMFKKNLQAHTYKELTQLVTQFENVLKSYLKGL